MSLRNVRTVRVVQALLFSVPGQLAQANVIAGVDISTGSAKPLTRSPWGAHERVSLKRSSCILSEANYEAETTKRPGGCEFMRPRLLILAQV